MPDRLSYLIHCSNLAENMKINKNEFSITKNTHLLAPLLDPTSRLLIQGADDF